MAEMNQSDYSIYIQQGLEREFPDFSNYVRFEKDVYVVEYQSLKNELVLWISSQNIELTIGFDKEGECIWHTHMSLLGAFEPENELIEGINLLNDIFTGKVVIVIDQNNEILVTENIEETKGCKVKTWNEF